MHPPNPKCRMCLGVGKKCSIKRRKNIEAHKDLECFGPPERNTLRPLCDVLPELVCKLGEEICMSLDVRKLVEKNPPFYRGCSPFNKPKRSSTLSGTPTGGAGDVL